ncbi:restriction endonuclease subunit S [Acinetobacter schindleri]|uniref:restriction endonuclease subunit S n=1 Tax=Acinetobacter schindleri TaxID=108981 RepID=UPI0032B3DD70
MVPNGWSKKELGDIAHITSGGTPSREKVEYWANGTIPWIRTTEVQNCVLNLEDTKEYITELGLKKSSAKLVPAGSILLAMIGQGKTRGQVALLNFEATTNQNCAVIIFNANNDPAFYFHYLLSQYENIRGASNSAGQSNLSGALVKTIRVPVPPLIEQKKIAQILSTWDQAILATEKLLENNQQQKKALMQQLLTGKKRLFDENGKRFSGAWKHIKLRSLIKEIKRDKEQNPNNIELLTVKLHNKGVIASGKFPNSTEGGRPYYKRFAGELIIGRQNLHNGGVAIVPSDCNGLIASNAISSFEVLKDCDINFILSIMSTSHFRYVIDNLTGGTGQKEVSVRELLNVLVFIPCIEEQRKIAKVISLANQEIDTLQKKLDCLKQEKKALMQQLLTGKKRVKVAA